MNQAFLFAVETYPREGGEASVERFVATGSQETRARRRLLDALHDAGLFVRQISVVTSKPAREFERDGHQF